MLPAGSARGWSMSWAAKASSWAAGRNQGMERNWVLNHCWVLPLGQYMGYIYIYILVGGLEHGCYFPSIGNFIIPTDELIFFSRVGQPPTSQSLDASARKNHNFPICGPTVSHGFLYFHRFSWWFNPQKAAASHGWAFSFRACYCKNQHPHGDSCFWGGLPWVGDQA